MPLNQEITLQPGTKLLIWSIEETEQELLEGIELRPSCEERLRGMRSDIHRKGFLSVRQLLKYAGYKPYQLSYDSFGKPHLDDSRHISISHSFQYSGIVLSDREVGVDLELRRKKLRSIAPKFVGYEYAFLSDPEDLSFLASIWCAKESMYKAFASKGVSFKSHCKVLPFHPQDGGGLGWIQYRDRLALYQIWYFQLGSYSGAVAYQI